MRIHQEYLQSQDCCQDPVAYFSWHYVLFDDFEVYQMVVNWMFHEAHEVMLRQMQMAQNYTTGNYINKYNTYGNRTNIYLGVTVLSDSSVSFTSWDLPLHIRNTIGGLGDSLVSLLSLLLLLLDIFCVMTTFSCALLDEKNFLGELFPFICLNKQIKCITD